jgi:hypothetical protein
MGLDPERHAGQLLQCLNQDKQRIGLLLGAGCPYSVKTDSGDPLITDIRGLTELIGGILSGGSFKVHWDNLCSQFREDYNREPNIEDILSRVRGLKDYVGNGEVRGFSKAVLTDLEEMICKEIKDCVSKILPSKSTPFHSLANWIGSINRAEPIEIFTTNYDLLLEQSLEDMRVPFFDGFVGAHHPFFDAYAIENDILPPRWARLWKIHGSISWRSGTVDRTFKVWRTDINQGGNAVIHPSHLKYEESRKMPYLAMMDRLKRFLSTPSSVLIIVGYSFNDQHLNDLILQGLQGTPSSAVFGLLYNSLTSYPVAESMSSQRGNLSLISRDGAIFGTKKHSWVKTSEIPDSNLPEGIVKWSKEDGASDLWSASFHLGDFRCFGAFLQQISGAKDLTA